MRLHRLHAPFLAFLIGLLAAPPAWCDEDDWVAGTPNLQLWKQLDTTQTELMQRFLDFSRQLPGVTPYYTAKWRRMEFTAPSLRPVPEFLRSALPGATEVSIRAYIRDFTGEVKRYGKPSPGDVNGHPTALWSIDPKGRWVIWQRDGLTLRMRASARGQDGKPVLSASECSLVVARVLDDFLGGHTRRKESIVILLDTSETMAGESMVRALNSAIWIARTGARHNKSKGPTTVEWALLTFAGDETSVQHPFTQDPELTGTYCGMLAPGGKSSRASLAWAVTHALAYLHTSANGSNGKVVIISNGKGTAKGEESIKRLNRLLARLRLRNDDRAPSAHYDRVPSAPHGQVANNSRVDAAGESLDDVLGRLERTAAASGKQARIHAVGVDPTADAAGLRSIAEAGGGRYLRGTTDAERAAAARQLATPGPTTPPRGSEGHPGRAGMPPAGGPPQPPVGEDVDDPLFGNGERLDLIIYSQDGAEIVETGKLTAFNGIYYTLTTDYGMPRRVLAQDVISLLLDGIGEGVPPNAAAGSIVLRDGRIVRGEIVRFEGNEFTVSKPDGSTMKLTRDQVQAVAVRSVDGGDMPPGGLPRLPAPDDGVPEDGSVSDRVLIGADAPGWTWKK